MAIDTVIVALCSLFGTIAGAWFANRKNSALVLYRLEQLENKVNLHNNVIERTYKLEARAAVFEQEINELRKANE